MLLLSLAYRSLLNRKLTTMVTLLSLGLSVSLWVGIEHIRSGARESFSQHDQPNRSDCRRARQSDPATALHGISHRDTDGQRH